jgi:hypothetical protein
MKRESINTIAELVDLEGKGKLSGLFNVPADIYHAGPGVGSSNIRALLRSGAHYKASIEKKGFDKEEMIDEKQSHALLFGSAAHTAILEADLFDCHYWTIQPKDKLDWRTKEGKKQKDDLLEKHKGKKELSYSMFLQIAELSEHTRAHKKVSKLIDGAMIEASAYAKCPITGVIRRVRPDAYNQAKGLVIDVKTTMDARPEPFMRSVINHGYHIQAAYYLDTLTALNLPATGFVFIAIEKKRPYGLCIYMLSEKFLQLGREKYQQGLHVYSQCQKDQIWHNYSDNVEVLELPRWVDAIEESEEW